MAESPAASPPQPAPEEKDTEVSTPSVPAESTSVDVLAQARALVSGVPANLKAVVGSVQSWQTEGTPLRAAIKSARLTLGDAYVNMSTNYKGLEEGMQEKLDTAKAHTAMALDRIGVEFNGFTDLRHRHPGLLIGAATVAVALPSALGGKRLLLRNGLLAAAFSSATVHGLNWWDLRRRG